MSEKSSIGKINNNKFVRVVLVTGLLAGGLVTADEIVAPGISRVVSNSEIDKKSQPSELENILIRYEHVGNLNSKTEIKRALGLSMQLLDGNIKLARYEKDIKIVLDFKTSHIDQGISSEMIDEFVLTFGQDGTYKLSTEMTPSLENAFTLLDEEDSSFLKKTLVNDQQKEKDNITAISVSLGKEEMGKVIETLAKLNSRAKKNPDYNIQPEMLGTFYSNYVTYDINYFPLEFDKESEAGKLINKLNLPGAVYWRGKSFFSSSPKYQNQSWALMYSAYSPDEDEPKVLRTIVKIEGKPASLDGLSESEIGFQLGALKDLDLDKQVDDLNKQLRK